MNKLLLIAILLATTAIVQPTERRDDARCSAAVQASDEGGVIVYCTHAAENHGFDTEYETGNLKALDLVSEASDITIIGLSHSIVGDQLPNSYYDEARELLTEARACATRADTLRLIDLMLTSPPLGSGAGE